MTRPLASSLAALAITITACTSPPVQPSPTLTPFTVTEPTTTTTTLPAEVAVSRFRECLVSRGIDIVEIPFDAYGRPRFDLVLARVDFSDPSNVEALAECRDHVQGGPLNLTDVPELHKEVMRRLQGFVTCVRERGIDDFPDPVAGFNGFGSPFPTDQIPYEDPDLPAAVEVCRTQLIRLSP